MSALPHCLSVAPVDLATPHHTASGNALDIALHACAHGDLLSNDAGTAGEEVGAVLEGTFSIAAAGEHYTLSAGEGIIIPAHEPRTWTCTSARGVLYRVLTRP